MAKTLLFFNPDPDVQDSDQLGYGDVVYSDGTVEYLSGDPEIAASLPLPPPGVNAGKTPPMGPPAEAPPEFGPPPPPAVIDTPQGKVQVGLDGSLKPHTGEQDPNTGELLEPGPNSGFAGGVAGELGNAIQGYPQAPGTAFQQSMSEGGQQSPASLMPTDPAALQAKPQPVIAADGKPYEVGLDGMFKPAGAGGAQPQNGNGMVPFSREGALPEDVATRQLGQLQEQNNRTLAATQQAQQDEHRLVNEMTMKQMAANEAERHQREQDLADQQARVERWQGEQKALLDQGIETDLVSARGPIGAALAVIGATLLGGAGNDAGFRMIENSIDMHVRNQVHRRDTKLGILSNQIGSSMQAIALGKAALYKVAADRLEILAQKTKNDVYEAQSPVAIEKLRAAGLAQFQEAERLSLGKTLEKTPLPPKPPSAELMQKYGQLRRDREGSSNIAQRAEQQIGLIWSPGKNGAPGHYANKDEVLKNGIQGVGNLEQWLPDSVYSSMGGMTAEGYQIRGAAEAMAYAQIKQMQPTGPISNADIQAAVKAGALNTEEGLVRGLERIRNTNESQQAHDAAQYGPDVVGEYNRRYQMSGGQTATATPAASRPATVEEMRNHAQALRQPKPGEPAQQQPEETSMAIPPKADQRMAQVREDLQALAPELPPEGLAILAAQAGHESREGDSEGAQHGNMFGHKQSGKRPGFSANTTEGEGAGAVRLKQNFASYGSITESVADHLSLLKRNYPIAWEALEVGDVDAYVAALKDGGYFTANEAVYKNALQRRL